MKKILLMMIVVLIGFSSCKDPITNSRLVTYYYKVELLDAKVQTVISITLPKNVKEPFKVGDQVINDKGKLWIVEDSFIDPTYCRIVEKLN